MEHMFSTSRNQDEGIVKLDGEEIPKIECFQYLGSIIHKGGPLCECRIPSKLKGKFIRLLKIRPAMLYGVESWIIKKHFHKMNVVEMKILR